MPLRATDLIEQAAAQGLSLIGQSGSAGSWAIPGEREKHGAGLLFFAFGREPVELHRSLVQATLAARTFREHNPGLGIAIASNNATVPAATFDVHVKARDDLVLAWCWRLPGSAALTARGTSLRKSIGWRTRRGASRGRSTRAWSAARAAPRRSSSRAPPSRGCGASTWRTRRRRSRRA